jgi:hypothetical protein
VDFKPFYTNNGTSQRAHREMKIVSCKRGLRPSGYDKEANSLIFHKENLIENPDLSIYRELFSNTPKLILLIEYPRKEHAERINKQGVIVQPLDDLLKEYLRLIKKEVIDRGNEGKENNYATRLLKGLLIKDLREIKV